MFTIIAGILLAVSSFIFTGAAIMLNFVVCTSAILRLDAFFIFMPFITGCAVTYLTFIGIIDRCKNDDTENCVLRKLDPNTGYLVRGRMSVVGDTIMSVMDIATEELLLVELATYYPPAGFTVEETRMGKDVLVPIGKKLLIGNNCELRIVSAG